MLTTQEIKRKKKVATSRKAKEKKKKEKKKKRKRKEATCPKKYKKKRELDKAYVQVNMGIFVSQEIQNPHPVENILVGSGENTRASPIFSPLLPPTKHPQKMFSPIFFYFLSICPEILPTKHTNEPQKILSQHARVYLPKDYSQLLWQGIKRESKRQQEKRAMTH